MNNINKLKQKYLKELNDDTSPLPRIIHIETRTKCNGICAFCPASINNDQREDISMSRDLIEKILDELARLNFTSRLSFYNNNEPFLDERIYDIIASARIKLPLSYLELKTNGLTLDLGKITKIFNAGLDTLYINDYSSDKKHHGNILKLIEDLDTVRRFKGHYEPKFNIYYDRIQIGLRDSNAVLNSRAGTSPNKPKPNKAITQPCFRPMEMMTISPSGTVGLCSEDFHYRSNMGNINNESLLNIWMSERWITLRKDLASGNRKNTDICSECDYKGYTSEMLKENNLIKKRWL